MTNHNEFIRRNFQTMSNSQLASKTGLTVNAVEHRLRRMDLHREKSTIKIGEPTTKTPVGEFSKYELALIKKSLSTTSPSDIHNHTFEGDYIKFGYYSDPHVGHKKFHTALWHEMCKRFIKEGIKIVYSPGDNLEGMSGRPGHIYELAQIGASNQLNEATKLFLAYPQLKFKVIDGNHDQWFKEKGNIGLTSGAELAKRCHNVEFLGEWEATVRLHKNVTMLLFHANDGTAYADSYKIQKLIESLEGGKKPNLILSGHYHKQVSIFRRNVFAFECGTLCGQSGFMKGKKLPAHMGFGIIEIWAGSHGIERLKHEFFPFYD